MIGILEANLDFDQTALHSWLRSHGIRFGVIRTREDIRRFDSFILPGHHLGAPSRNYWNWASLVLDHAARHDKPVLGICEGFYAMMRWELGRPFRSTEYWQLNAPEFNHRGQTHKHIMAFHKGLMSDSELEEMPTSLPFINSVRNRRRRWIGIAWHPEFSSDYNRNRIAAIIKTWSQ
jgi:gamma-glutamyl-gamma-aminobutyrate hydrolase PuuD